MSVKGREIELYVHVPFCVRKCGYCDFYSGPFGKAAEEKYVTDVLREIEECPFVNEEDRVRSVFIGGGTPSVLPAEAIGEILESLRRHFVFLSDAEITAEVNPGTVDSKKLRAYRGFGVNRLSIGLQSPDDEMLRKIGRIHTMAEFLQTYEDARAAGFGNINVDLLSGLPGETPESFEKGLKTVIGLAPEHFSVYALILEENTPFYALYEAGKLDLPSEEDERLMYRRTGEILGAAGYERYEISNYAKPGYRCRHNEGYWTHVPYLGFGAAAASFYEGKRFRNAAALDYLERPYEDTEVLSEDDLKNEFLMLGLRRTDGVSDADFKAHFGESFLDFKPEAVERITRNGLAVLSGLPGEMNLRLTARGLDLANLVFQEFLPD